MEFYETQKGKRMLFLNGFLYHISKEKDEEVRWRCKYRPFLGLLIIKKETLPPIEEKEHTCNSNEGKSIAFIAKLQILKKCKKANETFNAVYTSVTKELESDILSEVTSFDNLRDYARKIRNKKEIIIYQDLKTTYHLCFILL
ncbi:hypothetical protein DMUE_0013 [Dictyocoela muelleri]|nr:hypothetical protein DMUE_0013 [Dictyocoela muelleri]